MKLSQLILAVTIGTVSFFALLQPSGVMAQVRRTTARPLIPTAPKPLTTATPTPTAIASTGPHFYSGKSVDVTGDLKGDVFVFGQNVNVDANIDGDLLAAGGNVVIKGNVTQNIRVAGGWVELQGQVGKNMTVAAGTFNQTRQSKISGYLVSAANSVSVFGLVGQQAWVAGNNLILGGSFNDVQVHGQTVTVASGASISGNLSGQVTQNPIIHQNVVIKGQTNLEKIATPSTSLSDKAMAKVKGGMATWLIVSFLMALIGGAIILALFPAASLRLAKQIETAPLASLGWGIVYVILTPIIALMLMATILGLPLGIIVLLMYVITLMMGGWLAAYALGSRIYNPGPLPTYAQQLGQFALGLVILRVLELVPVLGVVIKIIVLMISLGGFIIVLREAMYAGPLIVPDSPAVIPAAVVEGRRSHARRGRPRKKTSRSRS